MIGNKPVAVVKVGGDVLLGEAERTGLANNVKDLIENGWHLVLLHGGGPQTNALQEKLGLVPHKIEGRRVTSAEDLTVVKQAIAGEVNVNLVSLLQEAGVAAFGCHGASGSLVQASKRPPKYMSSVHKEVDFGEVGDVEGINAELLKGLLELGQVPVVATLGIGKGGRIFNINADTTVVKIAEALQAELLLLTTAVGAVFEDLKKPETRIKQVNPEQARKLIVDGIIQGGMIPKVEEAMTLLERGVESIAIVGPSQAGAFLSVANGTGETGTKICKS